MNLGSLATDQVPLGLGTLRNLAWCPPEAHQPFADVVALRPHRGDAERGARRVVGLELGQELV